jgi:hypothetical protein
MDRALADWRVVQESSWTKELKPTTLTFSLSSVFLEDIWWNIVLGLPRVIFPLPPNPLQEVLCLSIVTRPLVYHLLYFVLFGFPIHFHPGEELEWMDGCWSPELIVGRAKQLGGVNHQIHIFIFRIFMILACIEVAFSQHFWP